MENITWGYNVVNIQHPEAFACMVVRMCFLGDAVA